MENKNKHTFFSAYTVFPFLSGRYDTTICPFLPTQRTTDTEKKRGFDYILYVHIVK